MNNQSINIRNNEQLKAPHATEYITKEEYEFRAQEIIRCRKDPIYFAEKYFTIVSPDPRVGKHIIKMYPKQKELINTMMNEDRICVLASRQVGKTTAYNVYALWLAMFHNDRNILICANTGDSSSDFVGRIRLAYELIPLWLKPGIDPRNWNKRKIQFSNGSSVASTTTGPAVRGKSCNTLILDEFAFVDPSIEKEFWEGVYPVISSAKGTKIIMVSTPNGTANKFYETYSRAELGIDEINGWKCFRIDWWEVPGRDEEWKALQIASLNGDMRAWAQEFGNEFFGSAYTLIDGDIIKKYKEYGPRAKKAQKIKFLGFDIFECKIWEAAQQGRTYVVGADVGEGIGSDYSVALVMDITEVDNIRIVASYANNKISTPEFSYLLVKLASSYNRAFISCECNSIGEGVLKTILNVYMYENIITTGQKQRTRVGIYSHNSIKVKACLHLKDLMNNDGVNIRIDEGNLIYEMEWFERKMPSAMMVFKAVGTKHDDYMMAFIWGLFVLHQDIIEDYYNVLETRQNKYGLPYPARIQSFSTNYYTENPFDDENNGTADIDRLFKSIAQNTLANTKEAMAREQVEKVDDENTPQVLGFIDADTGPINPYDQYSNTWGPVQPSQISSPNDLFHH